MKDINPGRADSPIVQGAVVAGVAYFGVDDGVNTAGAYPPTLFDPYVLAAVC